MRLAALVIVLALVALAELIHAASPEQWRNRAIYQAQLITPIRTLWFADLLFPTRFLPTEFLGVTMIPPLALRLGGGVEARFKA